jgi:hypothetical protein
MGDRAKAAQVCFAPMAMVAVVWATAFASAYATILMLSLVTFG